MSEMIQVEMCSGDMIRVAWVDRDVKAGDQLTLKNSEEPGRLWKVLYVYKTGAPPERGWRVGGIQ